MKVFITGGTGYIGAHLCAELISHGHSVTVSVKPHAKYKRVVSQIESLTANRPIIVPADVRDEDAMIHALRTFKPEVVINLAGIKSAGYDSLSQNHLFDVNVGGVKNLLRCMEITKVKKLIHASSDEVIHTTSTMSMLGQSKTIAEGFLYAHSKSNRTIQIVNMRTFKVSGNHPVGYLAEDDYSAKNDFITHLCQTACNERPYVTLFPCYRDYVHVMDVTRAYRAALDYLKSTRDLITTLEVGSGRKINPVEVLKIFELMNRVRVAYRTGPRPADVVEYSVANLTAIKEKLHWIPTSNIENICKDAWFSYTTGANSLTPPPISRISACRSQL